LGLRCRVASARFRRPRRSGLDGVVQSDGTKIVSASADKDRHGLAARHGQCPVLPSRITTPPVTIAQFSPDGKLIASAGGDKIFASSTPTPASRCARARGIKDITFLDFSRDSKRIVSGGADRRIKVWGRRHRQGDGADQRQSVGRRRPRLQPRRKQIAVANIDQTIRLYDALTGKLQQSWIAHGTAVSGVAYSPNGQYLASCGADLAVMVWLSPRREPTRSA